MPAKKTPTPRQGAVVKLDRLTAAAKERWGAEAHVLSPVRLFETDWTLTIIPRSKSTERIRVMAPTRERALILAAELLGVTPDRDGKRKVKGVCVN